MSKKIAVVGSFVMDLIAKVEAFPHAGQTIIGKAMETFPGGKGANQAVAAARLGADVQMFGKLGDDANGAEFLTLFNKEKIDVSCVQMHRELPTAMGLIQINAQAENKIVVIPGANFGYTIDDLLRDSEEFLKADLVVTQLELQHEVVFKLIELCADHNVPIILNPAPAVPLSDKILSKVSYLTPNETELEILTDMRVETLEDAKMAIDKLLKIGVKTVIATLGKNGALIGSESGFTHVPGYRVNAVDTVAAGDSFNGALAFGIVQSQSMESIVRFANAVGALTVTKQGAIPSLPTFEEVRVFTSKNSMI